MAKLIYITNASLDGYVEDESGDFHWVDADEVHAPVVEMLRPVGTYLYGRRMYETMAYWDGPIDDYAPEHRAFARVWQTAKKVVFSRTLTDASTRDTRIERDFDPDAVRQLMRRSERDVTIGGAELAGLALAADLVDECDVLLHPLILGGGKPAFRPGVKRHLELLETRRLGAAVIHLHYRTRRMVSR